MEKNVTQITKGLHTDNSHIDVPKGTYQYALNAVNETDEGDLFLLSNEESNEPCGPLPNDYIPLGKVYIGNNKTMIFSVNESETISEIGIRDAECNYTTQVNGNLGFKLAHQIDASYRLRRGCETTVYWVDGKNNKPMYYVVEKPGQFQDDAGNWDVNKFELQRSYNKVPVFQEIEVQNSGGQLKPGSYNVSIQYLDENLNPTEWITTSEIIKVYNDDTTESFLDIRGSINIEIGADIEDFRTFPTTDKSIRIELSNLDETFLFYRLAFIEATNGTGQITKINYTQNLSTQNNIFIYTGINFLTEGSEEEILAFNNVIESAGSIEQVDNMLILGETQGKQVNFCNLQKYASKIKADMTTKKVLANQIIDKANTKSPTAQFEGIGYMPGEIYSFAIVYVFKDGTLTPAYHIPGKSHNIIDLEGNNVSDYFVFSPGKNGQSVYPMSIENESENSRYNDNSNCNNKDYWGVDSTGTPLKSQKVRHHRFPLRSDIGVDLVNVENTVGDTNTYYQVSLTIEGNLITSYECLQPNIDAGECSILGERIFKSPFQVRVTYEVNGVEDSFIVNINPTDYLTEDFSSDISLVELSNFIIVDNESQINIISIEESTEDGTTSTIGVDSANSTLYGNLNYAVTKQPAEFTSETRVYSTQVYGIQFSGIDLPPATETGGEEIIGYYIVRNERTETEKTILDTAVLTPSVTNDKYISHGLLFPEFIEEEKISDKVYGLIHPEHKFNNKKYPEFTEMIQQGQYEIEERKKSKSRYRDVEDGTSFDGSVHKSGRKDKDGWSLKAIIRDNITKFKKTYAGFNFTQSDIEDVFYLDSLQSKETDIDPNQTDPELKTVYNIAGDNKVGIIQLKENNSTSIGNKLPYVYLKRPLADSYSTFRSSPYYKTSINMHNFFLGDGTKNPNSDTTVEFNGDTYITPMRYVNTMWWDNRIAKRSTKTSVFNFIIGGALALLGAALLIFGGAGALVIGAGVAVIGGGALFVSSGIKRDALVKAYYDEYDKGLRETTLDDWVDYEYKSLPCRQRGSCDTSADDQIEWIADCITDMWFESQVNISLRYGLTSGVPSFLDAPGKIESGNDFIEDRDEHFGIWMQRDNSIYPFNALDRHVMDKLLAFSPEREDSRAYIGHPLGEYYKINPDYNRINSQKVFFHLPIEYDCCSECQEDFPHRVHFSLQSFQEELTDNFRVFLPNNYRDIEGETGRITDLFRIKNNIYIHTEEGLWHQPQNFQERVTGEIVSFLGTGGYFSTPPRKILDDNKTSGGTKHREATIKTKHGVFFISENEKKIYKFDGNQLEAISDLGITNWFKENLDIRLLDDYYKANSKEYPYDNNPSNPFGTGFISTYDTKKERLIFTKKDNILSDEITNKEDFEICNKNGELIIFNNYQQTINTYINNGWSYIGLEECRMRFDKTGFNTETQIGEVTEIVVVPPDTIVIPFFDTTSMTDTTIVNISNTIDAWFPDFKASINGGDNNLTLLNESWGRWGTEDWLEVPQIALDNIGAGKEVLLLVFVDESDGPGTYHRGDLTDPMSAPSTGYIVDVNEFVNNVYPQFKSFKAINYPIVKNLPQNKEYLQHTIAAIEGRSMTQDEVDALNQNPIFSDAEWSILKNNLQNNPYIGQPPLKDFGWSYKENRVDGADNNGTAECLVDGVSVLTPCQFTIDIQDILTTQTSITVTPTEIEVQTSFIETIYVDGQPVEEFSKADNSWTMSFSLKAKTWTSWHSYLPNFYYYIADKFYSWGFGKKDQALQNTFWKHNVKGKYQNFYGKREPFSLEYTAMSEPLKTKIWDGITLHTEAKRYVPDMDQYVDVRDVTFNKGIFYNTRQCTGLLNLKVKDTDTPEEDYMLQQIVNVDPGTVIIDRNERDWSLNDIRDIRVDYDQPIFNADIVARQSEYYTDKILNDSALDENKSWEQLESLRDKYLVVRLIFDTFDDVKLIMNYSIENETDSLR